MSFDSLGLSPHIIKQLNKHNYAKAYPIQQAAIPAILEGKDVLGIAKTGSGKTASYVLPLLTKLQGRKFVKNRQVNMLVLVPTRELAEQVKDVFRMFSEDLPQPIRTLAAYGGVAINPQMKALFGINILIATPGRLLDLVDSNALELTHIETLVLDEADKMLQLGFKEEMNRIFALLATKRQNLLFSATLNEELEGLEKGLLHDPKVIRITSLVEEPELIEEVGYFVSEERKGPLLRFLLKDKKMDQVLVFVSSSFKADAVCDKLKNNGFKAMAIHSKKSQGARQKALNQFKDGEITILVSTDLLSRGIDIEFLPFVINYELPRSPKDYIHRIGRTGRAESPGEAITLVTPEEQHHFRVIQKKRKKWVTMIDSDSLSF
jgi:ATP-dependent RNA helicase RhlE